MRFSCSLFPFWVTSCRSRGCAWIRTRVRLWLIGQLQIPGKALLRFLGFANFYQCFIRNFSQLAAPLTALTSTKILFRWSSAAEAAFAKLKGCFVSAPILIAPDPSRQFVVEVDASEVGVGAILSQRSSSDDKMHPCAYFSHRLSPAERNYDIGNRELLAVKLALEEWHHWLEGSGLYYFLSAGFQEQIEYFGSKYELLIMKTCVKYFELKYSQLK